MMVGLVVVVVPTDKVVEVVQAQLAQIDQETMVVMAAQAHKIQLQV